MKFLVSLFIGVVAFASPCLADFDRSEITTMEQRVEMDLSDYGIVSGSAMQEVSSNQCFIDFRIQHRGSFQNRNNANSFCDDIHRFGGFKDFCYVRQFGDRFYETSFRFRAQGRGNDFRSIFDNIHNFLDRGRFFGSGFEVVFTKFSSGRCF